MALLSVGRRKKTGITIEQRRGREEEGREERGEKREEREEERREAEEREEEREEECDILIYMQKFNSVIEAERYLMLPKLRCCRTTPAHYLNFPCRPREPRYVAARARVSRAFIATPWGGGFTCHPLALFITLLPHSCLYQLAGSSL